MEGINLTIPCYQRLRSYKKESLVYFSPFPFNLVLERGACMINFSIMQEQQSNVNASINLMEDCKVSISRETNFIDSIK